MWHINPSQTYWLAHRALQKKGMSAASVQHISNPTFLRPISHPTLVLQQLIKKSLLKTQYKPLKLFHPPSDPLFVVEECVATDRLSG
jgi:hypothetical protein